MSVIWSGGVQGGAAQPVFVVGGGQAGEGLSGAPVSETWRVALQVDETADDSDKTFTVPAGQEWQVLWVWVELVTTATAGNRQLVVQLQDAEGDVIGELRAGLVQAASLTRKYMFAPGVENMGAFLDTDFASCQFPPVFLSAGQKVRVYDKAAIAAAADDMVVQMQVAARAV